MLIVGNFLSRTQHTRDMGEELNIRLQERGWPVITTSRFPNRVLRLMDMLGTTLIRARDYHIALVEVYSGRAFIWAEMVCTLLMLLRKTVILVLHGGGLPEFAKQNHERVDRLFRMADRVVTPSQWIALSLSTFRADIQTIPNGIDINQYTFVSRINPTPCLCWLRAFHAIYQPWMAVEVLASVKRSFPTATLLLIGPDKSDGSFERTKNKIRELNLEGSVILIGGIDKSKVPEWLHRANIFLNTTLLESFGVSVVEAAACGLPIVTTNAGELPYLWKDGEDALLVPPDDPMAMAAAVRRILTEPGLAQKISINARRKAEQFDWKIILPMWERLLSEYESS